MSQTRQNTADRKGAFEATLSRIAVLHSPWRELAIATLGVVASAMALMSFLASMAFFLPIWLVLIFKSPFLLALLFVLGPACLTALTYSYVRFRLWQKNETRPWSHRLLLRLIIRTWLVLAFNFHTFGVFLLVMSAWWGTSFLEMFPLMGRKREGSVLLEDALFEHHPETSD
ncbi:hypothetical protein [Parvibaculum sp.]|uniref:hypothetical protein n=1 Tax=Parvibaculum sp. TaxID=2024848 RepID=UPI003210E3A5